MGLIRTLHMPGTPVSQYGVEAAVPYPTQASPTGATVGA